MINIRTRKVLRDLWNSKARTALVIASIAVGLVAVSTTLRAQALFSANLGLSLEAINPASAALLTYGAGEDAVEAVTALDSIDEAEGRQIVWARVKSGGEYRPIKLVAMPDFETMNIDKITPVSGEWPPAAGSLLIERSSLGSLGVPVGDQLEIESPNGQSYTLELAGEVHDLTIVSGELLDQVLFGYISQESLASLGVPPGYNEIRVLISGDRLDEAAIQAAAEEAGEVVEAQGAFLLGSRIPAPGKHLMDNVIGSLLLILGSLGLLSLLLSAFLLFNTVSALLARQIPQIGVMKAIGAPRSDILGMYLATILTFSAAAVVIAVPLGVLGARLMTSQLAKLLNFDITDTQVPPWLFLVELVIGLLGPLLAALYPILSGAGITVREALTSQSAAAAQFGEGLIDRLLGKLRGLPASLSYAIRNIFRRKVRLALTLATLSLGGSIFITVLSVRDSLYLTIDDIAAYWGQDVTVDLQGPVPFKALETMVAELPGVQAVEGWSAFPAFRLGADGVQSPDELTVFALPLDSQFIRPTLIEGRWLETGDENALVINNDFADLEPDLAVGDPVTLKLNGQEAEWRLVGIVTTQMIGVGEPMPAIPMAYAPYQTAADLLRLPGQVNRLAVSGGDHTAAAQTELAGLVEAELEANQVRMRSVETNAANRAQAENLTMPILLLLLSMAALFALVGGLSLTGTMSLNVLERTQEIGIIRAIGATSRDVMSTVIIEGLFVGLISWLLAALLAYPMGWMMSASVGINFINVPLTYAFAPAGIGLWLLIVIGLSVFASYIPARGASRLVVREALAHE